MKMIKAITLETERSSTYLECPYCKTTIWVDSIGYNGRSYFKTCPECQKPIEIVVKIIISIAKF